MKLDYFTLLSDEPIKLSNIGTLVPPKLIDIRKKIGIDTYNVFLSLTKLTPKKYYVDVCKKTEYWETLTKKEKMDITLYDVVIDNTPLMYQYISMFSFFFKEDVYIKEYSFILLNPEITHKFQKDEIQLQENELIGIINAKNFDDILYLIRQICYIQNDDEDEKRIKFKNKKAKKLWDKMQNSPQMKKTKKDSEQTYSMGNIVSAVAYKNPSTDIVSIWNWTVFQLYDQFTRIKFDKRQSISDTRISVWGDEKGQYKDTLWCMNYYDKN